MAPLPDFSSVRRVLVIKPSSLGDIVHTLPAVHLLKGRFPHMEIAWLVNPEFAPLLDGNHDVSEAVHFPRQEFRGWSGRRKLWTWLRQFRRRGAPDAVLDFQGLLRSALLARISSARIRVGMSDSREGSRLFYTHCVRVDRAAHAVSRNVSTVEALGASGSIEFPLPEGIRPQAIPPALMSQPFILLHPFSRGEDKSLTPGQVQTFCETMKHMPVVIASRTEFTIPKLPAPHVDLLNRTTLAELIWLMRRASFIVSVDSGPLHMAAALTDRVLGLHTWSDPRRVGPFPAGAHVWKAGHIMRCDALEAAVCSGGGRLLTDDDVRNAAEFVWRAVQS